MQQRVRSERNSQQSVDYVLGWSGEFRLSFSMVPPQIFAEQDSERAFHFATSSRVRLMPHVLSIWEPWGFDASLCGQIVLALRPNRRKDLTQVNGEGAYKVELERLAWETAKIGELASNIPNFQ